MNEVLKRLHEHRDMHENSRKIALSAAERQTQLADAHLRDARAFEEAIEKLTGVPYAPVPNEKRDN